MKLSEKEESLLLRGLDKASAPAEAEKAAEALFESLRRRGVSGYELAQQLEEARKAKESREGLELFRRNMARSMRDQANGWPRAAFDEVLESDDEMSEKEFDRRVRKVQRRMQRESGFCSGRPAFGQSPKEHNQEAPKLLSLLFICFAIGIVTILSHSFVAGFFIAGPVAAGLCFYPQFRKVVVWCFLALIVIFVAINVFLYVEGQQKIAVRTRAPYFGFRVANAEEVQRYDTYIHNGGDPNQVPIYDRLAVALYKNPNFLLENKSTLDELQQKRP